MIESKCLLREGSGLVIIEHLIRGSGKEKIRYFGLVKTSFTCSICWQAIELRTLQTYHIRLREL